MKVHIILMHFLNEKENFFTISMSFVELQRNEINDYAYQKSPHQTFFTLTLSCDVQHTYFNLWIFMNSFFIARMYVPTEHSRTSSSVITNIIPKHAFPRIRNPNLRMRRMQYHWQGTHIPFSVIFSDASSHLF